MKRFSFIGATLLGATLALVATAPARAETIKLKAEVKGSTQVPPTESRGAGVGDVTYDTVSHVLTWSVTFSGMTGPAMAAHFHGPAEPDANAGPIVVMEGLASPLVGTAVLTDDQAGQLLGGLWYINIHTAAHPGGEIRGQVLRAP